FSASEGRVEMEIKTTDVALSVRPRRRYLVWAVLALLVFASATWFEPTFTVRGWAYGDPFFGSRSAHWWERELRREDQDEQVRTRLRLVEGGSAAVPVLTMLLSSPDTAVRSKAAEVLATMGQQAEPAAPRLGEALKDPDPGVRSIAAQALEKIAPNGLDPTVVNALVEVLGTRDRQLAFGPLRKLGNAAVAGIPALVAILNDESAGPSDREGAAQTLMRIEPATKTLVPN